MEVHYVIRSLKLRGFFVLLGVRDHTTFFNNFNDLVCDNYLGGCGEREIKASSIKTYIPSLQEFFTFLYIKGIKPTVIISSKAKCELWKNKYNLQAKGELKFGNC